MHIDGEPVHTSAEVNVKIVHKGLKVFVPSTADLIEKREERTKMFSLH